MEAEKNQEQLMEGEQEQVRSLEEENDVQQQVQCPPGNEALRRVSSVRT